MGTIRCLPHHPLLYLAAAQSHRLVRHHRSSTSSSSFQPTLTAQILDAANNPSVLPLPEPIVFPKTNDVVVLR